MPTAAFKYLHRFVPAFATTHRPHLGSAQLAHLRHTKLEPGLRPRGRGSALDAAPLSVSSLRSVFISGTQSCSCFVHSNTGRRLKPRRRPTGRRGRSNPDYTSNKDKQHSSDVKGRMEGRHRHGRSGSEIKSALESLPLYYL